MQSVENILSFDKELSLSKESCDLLFNNARRVTGFPPLFSGTYISNG